MSEKRMEFGNLANTRRADGPSGVLAPTFLSLNFVGMIVPKFIADLVLSGSPASFLANGVPDQAKKHLPGRIPFAGLGRP